MRFQWINDGKRDSSIGKGKPIPLGWFPGRVKRGGSNRNKIKFWHHKFGARKRGISFLLTFDEWWKIWQDSGHWEERGTKGGQYVMARFLVIKGHTHWATSRYVL